MRVRFEKIEGAFLLAFKQKFYTCYRYNTSILTLKSSMLQLSQAIS